MTVENIPYETINKLHPNLLLLLRKICVIERTTINDLVLKICTYSRDKTSLEITISFFCANYFAQSSTLQGHKAARHGQNRFTIKTVSDAIQINKKRYDLSLLVPNDSLISEDIEKYKN